MFLSVVCLLRTVNGAIIIGSSLSISEAYDDNVFFNNKDQKGGFITTISPGLNIKITSKYLILGVGYRGSGKFYSQNPESNGYFQSLSLDIDLPFLNRQTRRLKVKATERVSFSPELPAFSFGDAGTDDARLNQVCRQSDCVQVGLVDTFRNYAGISLDYTWSNNFNTLVSYVNVITRYSGSNIQNLQNSTVNNGSIAGLYRYSTSPRTKWTGQYGISATSGSKTSGEGDDFFQRLSLGVTHQIDHFLSVSGDLGVVLVAGESPIPRVGADISKRYKTGQLYLRYSSGAAFGLGVISGATRRQSIVGGASRKLGQRISSSVQVGYANNQSFDTNKVDVSAYTASAAISMPLLSSWLSGSLRYSYLNQRSKGGVGKDGERNTVMFTVTAIGPNWRIMK